MSNELTDVCCPCGAEFQADSYDAGFIAGSGMCQNCDAALPPKDICTCPSGDGSLRHPCPAHPASVELAGVGAKLTFINGRPAMCGCQVEYSSGGGEYSDVIDVTLCAKHSGSAILDLVATNRIALTPEYEGQWHADLYLDREIPLAKAEGATPAEAVLALMSAERIDPEQESVEQAGGDERAAFEAAYPELVALVRWNEEKQEYNSGEKGLGWQLGLTATQWLDVWKKARAALAQPSPALPPFAEKVLAKLRRFYDCAEDFESGGVDIGRHWLDLLTQLGLLNRVQRSPALWEISQQGEDLLGMPQPSPAPELPERGTQHRFGTNEQSCRHDFAGVWWNDNGETKTGRECRHCGFFVADVAEQAEAERPEVFGLERYRVEKTGQGFWPYCVRAGDGTRELFVGHLKQCKRVAAQLATAFEDGKFIAQHESIVGGLRAEITQLRQHKNDYMDAGQETYRALQNEIREREAEIARLDGLVSGRTAERDAALARVAELEQKSAGSWTVDTSCGRPILMYEGCSVIEDQTAYEVIRMIKWIGELERQEPVATVAKVPGEDWNSLDFHRDLQDMQPGTKFYAAPVAQAQQLHDLDKQCRDDVARALGLRPNQERGFAWSYLLASIKSCVKASEDSAQAQHSVPDGWKLVPVEPTPEMLDARRDCEDGMDGYLVEDTEYYFPDRGAVRAFLARVYQGLIAAAPAPGGER
ncbi:hypothetical protein ACM76A_30470 [Pseudomonas aeruginosa]